jgi:hypothetical protein
MSDAIQRITTRPLGHRPKLKLPFVHLVVDEELLERIDDFRFSFRLPSRSEAIRWLITAALDQNPIPEPDWERYSSREPRKGDPKTGVFDPPPKRRRSR